MGLRCWVWDKANAELVALVVGPWKTELVAYWLVVGSWFWADLVAYWLLGLWAEALGSLGLRSQGLLVQLVPCDL